MSQLEKRVRELWSTNATEQRALMRTLQAEGYKPGEILREIQVMRSGGVRQSKKGASIDPRLAGCQRDDEGQVVDPFSLKSIAPENLVGYTTREGARFCFDRRSLYRQYVLGGYQPLQNPFTRELMPNSLHQEVIAYGESLRTSLVIDHRKIVVEPFTMIGEIIVQYFASLGSDYLGRIASTNLVYRGQSLYREALTADAQTLDDLIESRPFANLLEKSELLILLFEFVKELRSRPQYETIYLHIGSVLAMAPLVAKEDGFDLHLSGEMTVIEVVKEFYRALREKFGRNVYAEFDIVTEYGETLASLDLQESISAQIPGEMLHYVPYSHEQDSPNTVHWYRREAFYTNDRAWLDQINEGEEIPRTPDPEIYEINYTVREFREYLSPVIREKRLREEIEENYSVVELIRELEYNRVGDTLVHPLLLQVIQMNNTVLLQTLLELFQDIDGFNIRHALLQYDLGEMKPATREFIARRIAGLTGETIVKDFYSGRSIGKVSNRIVFILDDVNIFSHLFDQLVTRDDKQGLASLLSAENIGSTIKILEFVRTKIESKYSWRALFGLIRGEEYESLFASVNNEDLRQGLMDMEWLEATVTTQYFDDCFRSLVTRLDDDLYYSADWESCSEVFQYEGTVSYLSDPYFVLQRLLKGGKSYILAYFFSSLTEKQAQEVLEQYPQVYGFEEALKMGYAITLPPVGSRERAQLINHTVYAREVDLLLQYLISLREDVDLAVEIILGEDMKIYRQTASYLLGGASYDDVVSLLDRYFVEQLEFGVLPLEYFRRFLREFPGVTPGLTEEQRELLS